MKRAWIRWKRGEGVLVRLVLWGACCVLEGGNGMGGKGCRDIPSRRPGWRPWLPGGGDYIVDLITLSVMFCDTDKTSAWIEGCSHRGSTGGGAE